MDSPRFCGWSELRIPVAEQYFFEHRALAAARGGSQVSLPRYGVGPVRVFFQLPEDSPAPGGILGRVLLSDPFKPGFIALQIAYLKGVYIQLVLRLPGPPFQRRPGAGSIFY